jgi:hypothetical protein
MDDPDEWLPAGNQKNGRVLGHNLYIECLVGRIDLPRIVGLAKSRENDVSRFVIY